MFRNETQLAGWLSAAVYIFRKALLLCAELYNRFQQLPKNGGHSVSEPAPFNFPDVSSLPIFADDVAPSLLTRSSVIEVSGGALLRKIQTGEAVSQREAAVMRATAVVACEEISRQAGESGSYNESGSFAQQELNLYLRMIAEASGSHGPDAWRLVFKDTMFF